MNMWKKLKTRIIQIPTLLILGIFGMTAAILHLTGKRLRMTYNEVNIIVYYLLIPLSWCIILDLIIKLPIFTPLWLILWGYIFWSKRNFWGQWCDTAFQLSVEFLLKFQTIGWNYWKSSVIICVVVPIIIYIEEYPLTFFNLSCWELIIT